MRVLFIVNPIAGGIIKDFSVYPARYLDITKHKYNIVYSEYAGHAEVLARDSNADIVVAVGGDGTVNEVGKALIGSEKILGIIPCGSGNGLARHLGFSNHWEAFNSINQVQTIQMDTGLINGCVFLCTCGVGLDAEVSQLFANSKRRGLLVYCVDTIKAWKNYSPQQYDITIDGITYTEKAMLITVGNANQWGNNALITPLASICDGMLDVTVLHDFCFFNTPRLLTQLLTGRLYNNRKISHYKGKTIIINRADIGPAHFDGDPIAMGRTINISLSNRKIRVLSGKREV